MSKDNRGPGRPRNQVRKTREEVIEEKRKKRQKVQDLRGSMAMTNMEEGYMYRWVNDKPGHVQRFLDLGWEFVEDPDKTLEIGEDSESANTSMGSAVSQYVGVSKENRELRAYLMRIEEELYEDGQVDKAKELDKVDNALRRRGTLDGQGVESSYQPNGAPKYNASITKGEYTP